MNYNDYAYRIPLSKLVEEMPYSSNIEENNKNILKLLIQVRKLTIKECQDSLDPYQVDYDNYIIALTDLPVDTLPDQNSTLVTLRTMIDNKLKINKRW